MSALPNCSYIPGVSPGEVAPFVVNCDVFLVPYPLGNLRTPTIGLTAKLLQAMAARKPIIARNVNPGLSQYGVQVCDTDDEFVAGVRDSLAEGARIYPVDLEAYDWALIQSDFLSIVDCTLARTRLMSVKQ